MLHKLIDWYDRTVGVEPVSAHCDIPCKIYDPSAAQIAALSVLRFMDLIADVEKKGNLSVADQAELVRLTLQKEEHAEIAKHEIRVIWGDYIKQPHIDKYPDVHSLAHSIMMAGSACKQGLDRANGEKLLKLINEFAELFWATKDVTTFTATCPYPPNETVVYPKLN